MNIWNELGIEPTRDLRKIKLAYAARLKQTNPEDDAAAFQRLRQAYDFAQALARNAAAPVLEPAPDDEPAPPPSPPPAMAEAAAEIAAPPTASAAAHAMLERLLAALPRERHGLLQEMLRQPGWESLDFRQQLEAAVVQQLLRDFERLQVLVASCARQYGWRRDVSAGQGPDLGSALAQLLARSAGRDWWLSIANTSLKKSAPLRQALAFLRAAPDEAAFRLYARRAANRLAMHQVLVRLQGEFPATAQFDVDRASLDWWSEYDGNLKEADRRVYDYSGLATALFWLCLGGVLFWIGRPDSAPPTRPPAHATPAAAAHPHGEGMPAIQLPQSGPSVSSTALPASSQRSGWPPDYLAGIDRAVSAQVRYPPQAVRDLHQGTVVLRLDLRRDGSIEQVGLLRSSGVAELDAEALAAVNRVGRFPAAPAGAYPQAKTISFTFPVDFRLQ